MVHLTVPSRFNGPPRSGNGGYVCGLVAGQAGVDVAVSLRRPPPLDRPLDVHVGADGGVELRDGDDVVALGEPAAAPAVAVPAVVTVEEAADAVDDYLGWEQHVFPSCFVCGIDRRDGMHLFTGPVPGEEDCGLVASPWFPAADLDRGDGTVADPFVWASLDCPSYFGAAAPRPAVLGRLGVRLDAPVQVGAPHVVLGWRIGAEGRRLHAGSAVLDASGRVLAVGESTWVEISQEALASFL